MTKINKNRRDHRISTLKRAIQLLQDEGHNEVNAVIVHRKIQELSKNEDASIREVSNRLRTYQKVLHIRTRGKKPILSNMWYGGTGKITVYEIL